MTSEQLLQPRSSAAGEWLSSFELHADMRDLALDGRHWRAQFGGSSGAGPKMGAYICCGPLAYALFRLLLASATIVTLVFELAPDREGAPGTRWFLYVESWTLIVACFYFVLAFFLTLTAVSSAGKESASTPLPVLLCWVCYGILVPASLSCALMWIFITQSSDNNRFLSASGHPGASIGSTLFIWILVYLDMYVNRQPYYASFHGFCGIIFCWIYVLFNYLYTVGRGGDTYIYRQLNWDQYMSAGKLLMLQLFLLLPYFNALFWSVVWARRRARVVAKLGAV